MKTATKPFKLPTTYGLVFSPESLLLAVDSRHHVAVWDIDKQVRRFRVNPFSWPTEMCFSPSGKQLAVKNTSGEIVVLDSSSGERLHAISKGCDGEGSNLLYSACGDFLVDGSWNGHLTVRSATSGEIAFRRNFAGDMLTQVAYCAYTAEWCVLHWPKATAPDQPPANGYITVWKWPFVEHHKQILLASWRVHGFAVSPDAAMLATIDAGPCHTLSIIRTVDSQCLHSVQAVKSGRKVLWSPDGAQIAAVHNDAVVFYSAPDLSCLGRLNAAHTVEYSPDGESLGLGIENGGLLLDRASLLEKIRSPPAD